MVLLSTASPEAAEKKQLPGTTEYLNQPARPAVEMPKRDFKVERVFISEESAPDVALTALTAGGNYQFNCEVSYTGDSLSATFSPCPGGTTRGYVTHKVDGKLARDDNACLAPNGRTTIRAVLSAVQKEMVFSAGSHSYECRIDLVNSTDTSPGNNAVTLPYTVNKPKKTLQPAHLPQRQN
jgi:hypothetical protein